MTARRSAAPRVGTCVDDSTLTRALYSSDASLYRVVPQAVARPRSVDELVSVVRQSLRQGVPVTGRGAGTSCAGNAVGPGLVVDTARHLNRIIAIDPQARTATVEPGVVQAALQRAAAPHGLRFGPDPSTHNRCTLGGMIGNNACGPRALGYGRTSDNVVSLEVLTGTGDLITLGHTAGRVSEGRPDPHPRSGLDTQGGSAQPPSTLSGRARRVDTTLTDLRVLVGANLGVIRTEFGRFGRQVSGYSLEHLLPEHGFDVARFFAGTEGTLGLVTRATVRLVADAPVAVMVALGYSTMAEAADAMPALLPFGPVASEGIDRRIVDVVERRFGASAVPPLPRGDGWVFVELVGDDATEVLDRARGLLAASGALEGWVVDDPVKARVLWKIREDGAGLAGVSLAEPAYPGWEDAAVPADRLGAYLRDFDALLSSHGLEGLPYGHFGDGCVHCRIDFPLESADGPGRYRDFVEQAAALVASHGGSMSGEHGDGRARSALLPHMYSSAAIGLFGQVKGIFDPDNLLNPGVLVDPRPVEADIRVSATVGSPLRLADPHFVREVHQCSGVGKCLANTTAAGGVMCPSYQATRDELDSTRGRSRVLQEMVNGSLVSQGWRSPEVHEALDLCLSCKGCARDCPTGIDMAAYKARVLHETYRGRVRPRSHYSLGMLPRWGRLVGRVPGLAGVANLVMRVPGLVHLLRWAAGVDQRRPLPKFRTVSATRERDNTARWLSQRSESHPQDTTLRPRVAIWVDSFSDAFEGHQVGALLTLLNQAGFDPEVIAEPACCGLTWISTGQLDGARRQLRNAVEVLGPIAEAGVPIVGLEPSCLAVWRSDAAELLPDEPRVPVIAAATRTLAELLADVPENAWTPPDLTGTTVVAQPHCHHGSILGWAPDAALLQRTGACVVTLGGCCGLAGNFGVEQGHYETSVAVAEHDLLPALRAHPDAIVLADGFSCRKQASDLAARPSVTLAELLVRG